jgi:hypothetical protein
MARWLTPIILVAFEAEIRSKQARPQQGKTRDPIQKMTKARRDSNGSRAPI